MPRRGAPGVATAPELYRFHRVVHLQLEQGHGRVSPQRENIAMLAFESATSLAAKVASRTVGSRELLENYIERIARYDGEINSVVVRDFARARDRADQAD